MGGNFTYFWTNLDHRIAKKIFFTFDSSFSSSVYQFSLTEYLKNNIRNILQMQVCSIAIWTHETFDADLTVLSSVYSAINQSAQKNFLSRDLNF